MWYTRLGIKSKWLELVRLIPINDNAKNSNRTHAKHCCKVSKLKSQYW